MQRQHIFQRKDHSTLSKIEYFTDHILYSIIYGYAAFVFLPIIVSKATHQESLLQLTLCLITSNLIGLLISYHYNRNTFGVFIDIVWGLGLYVLVTLGGYAPELVFILIVCFSVVTLLNVGLILSRKIKSDMRKEILKLRLHNCLLIGRRNCGMLGFFILLLVPSLLHIRPSVKLMNDYYKATGISAEQYSLPKNIKTPTSNSKNTDKYPVATPYDFRYNLENNIDVIKKIRTNEEFQSLTYEEKTEVIKALVYCEAKYLGCCKIKIDFSDTMDDLILGSYNHATKTISINAKSLKNNSSYGSSNEEILDTIFHELRHCYQYLMVESYIRATPEARNLLIYWDVANWVENMENYNHTERNGSTRDWIKYRTQPLEVDASEYAQREVREFMECIDKMTEN